MERGRGPAAIATTTVLLATLAFAIGAGGYLLLALWLTRSPVLVVVDALAVAHAQVGVTFPALAALTVYLFGVVVLLALRDLGLFSFARSPRQHLLWIENASPMLGFLGTLIGLAEAMGGLETSRGMQAMVVWLTAKTGEAIYSSIYGAVQALAAYGVRFLFRLDEDEARP